MKVEYGSMSPGRLIRGKQKGSKTFKGAREFIMLKRYIKPVKHKKILKFISWVCLFSLRIPRFLSGEGINVSIFWDI